ncbi:MAG: assimilatory sulfite reductase (NADPH) hemoprotein subunit [Gammaproteobacteria bacterium]
MSNKSFSDVERIKTASHHLRGTLVESLANNITGAIADDDTQLSKFHGTYMQDDRDSRGERKRRRLEPDYSFMIRARLPGGICTPEQWLAVDALSDEYANSSIRLTTRQAFQFHGVIKRELKATIQGINQTLLDTIAACGDVNRNVMCSPNPHLSTAHQQVHKWADKISAHLTPQTQAYHEIWLDGEKLTPEPEVVEPIYGDTYLPRKFKTGVVIPPQNDIDVYTQDLGYIAVIENSQLVGFNVTAGGGMGSTHGDVTTFPRLADVLGFCRPEQVLDVAEAVVTTQRDFGDRTDRKHARLKYTIETHGVDWFRGEVERRQGFKFEAARDITLRGTGDRLGWTQGEDGLWHFTVFIDSGRVNDQAKPGRRLKSGLAAIAKVHRGEFRLSPNQNMVIANIDSTQKAKIEALLIKYDMHAPVSALTSHAMACVALPTCGLAMAEAERYLPDFVGRVESLMRSHGVEEQPVVLRITGCPNGCARPFVAEIGLVGKGPGRYNLYLGGGHSGERLNKLYAENVDERQILDALDPLFERYALERDSEGQSGYEPFGDFLVRTGEIKATSSGSNFHDDTHAHGGDV